MAVRNDPQQLGPLFVLALVGLGGLGYWWLQLDEGRRLSTLARVAVAEGPQQVGRIPRGSVGLQAWWLVRHRGAQLSGMARLVALAAVIGLLEGRRRREAAPLAGFGLGQFTLGRVVGALSLGGLLVYVLTPAPMPFAGAAVVLSLGFGLGMYLLARGMPRVS